MPMPRTVSAAANRTLVVNAVSRRAVSPLLFIDDGRADPEIECHLEIQHQRQRGPNTPKSSGARRRASTTVDATPRTCRCPSKRPTTGVPSWRSCPVSASRPFLRRRSWCLPGCGLPPCIFRNPIRGACRATPPSITLPRFSPRPNGLEGRFDPILRTSQCGSGFSRMPSCANSVASSPQARPRPEVRKYGRHRRCERRRSCCAAEGARSCRPRPCGVLSGLVGGKIIATFIPLDTRRSRSLTSSRRLGFEQVPTLQRMAAGAEVDRAAQCLLLHQFLHPTRHRREAFAGRQGGLHLSWERPLHHYPADNALSGEFMDGLRRLGIMNEAVGVAVECGEKGI